MEQEQKETENLDKKEELNRHQEQGLGQAGSRRVKRINIRNRVVNRIMNRDGFRNRVKTGSK